MKLSSWATCALLACACAAAPARANAQEAEAWVLPRGLLEVSATGSYTGWDTRLDGLPLGAELFGAYESMADRLLAGRVDPVGAGLADLFATVPDPEPGGEAPDPVSAGRTSIRFAGDLRNVPFTVRYGLTSRLTIFATVPLERSGTVVFGPYLAGGTLGLNPDTTGNRTRLAEVDARFGDLGGGLLLPTAESVQGLELQSRLRAIDPTDTLALPTRAVSFADLLARPALRALLSDEEAAALALNSRRRPYHLGDVQLGARFLLIRGPAGWPFPDTVVRRSLRTSVGARVRLPTGRGDTRTAIELPPGGRHFGVGVDVLNDVFLSSRWYVNVSASGEWLLPAEVVRQASTAERPFPADTALRTLRRVPGPRVALSVTPRWRLTDEISFNGEYAMVAQARTRYEAPEGVLPGPFDWRTGGAAHALGIGARYSSLQAFARRRARVPFELALTISQAVVGTQQAPDAFSVRLTGRVFVDPRRFRALLPGRGTDRVIPPPDAPVDTVPSQARPDDAQPTVEPTTTDTSPPATPPAPPPAPTTRPPTDSAARRDE